MATKKESASRKTAKKSSKKRATTKKATKPAASKRASTRKPAAKKPRKKAAKRRVAPQLESGVACGVCVVGVLRNASGREPLPQMKLRDLFNVCNPGVIQALRSAFAQCPGADTGASFNCGSTVAQVVANVCGV